MRTVTTGPSTRSSTLSRVRMEASGKLEFCLQRDIGHRDISSYQLLCFGKNRYPFAKRVTLDHSPRYFPIILRVSWSFGNSIPQDVSTLSLYHVLCFRYLISCTPQHVCTLHIVNSSYCFCSFHHNRCYWRSTVSLTHLRLTLTVPGRPFHFMPISGTLESDMLGSLHSFLHFQLEALQTFNCSPYCQPMVFSGFIYYK